MGGAGVFGVLLVSPWWLQSWQAWNEAHAAKAQQVAQQESTQALRAQTEQLLQSQSQVVLADVAVLHRLAQAQGLQFAQVGLDKPQHSAAMTALHMQQLPVHLTVQGSWEGWLHWLAHAATAAPGVTVASLELKADAGGVSAHVVVDVPQLVANLEGVGIKDCFNVGADQRELAAKVVHHLLHLIATVSPGAKRGSTAPFEWAKLMLVEGVGAKVTPDAIDGIIAPLRPGVHVRACASRIASTSAK